MVWRGLWHEVANQQQFISKYDAVEQIKKNAQEQLSPSLIKALKAQIDVNGDGQIGYHEFARACDKIL